ncbi:MAG TPA: CBS domain-containing protein [Amycolatopsis sp.]|nr:CBS domain-containing protein [Amycolatopsis sp.]
MRNMAVQDVMTTGVFAVRESTPIANVARIMDDRGISALPVASAGGRVVGMISDGDLLPRRIARPWGPLARLAWRRRAAGRRAGEVMSSPAITIAADAAVVEAARRMVRHGVKRLPVLDRHGKLVGLVSRADLVRAFVRPDEELRAEIEREVLGQTLRLAPGAVRADVTDGVVTLSGAVARKSLIPITVTLARHVLGVVEVAPRLTFAIDDTRDTRDTRDSRDTRARSAQPAGHGGREDRP